MSDGFALVDRMIAAARAAGQLPQKTAELAAPLIDAALKKTAAAGTTPSGEPWAPRKKDGGRALEGAAAAISTKAVGSAVRVTLTGPAAIHHYGEAKRGTPRRQVIPDAGELPAPVVEAVREAAGKAFARAVGGG